MQRYLFLPIFICLAGYAFSQKTSNSTNPDARRAAAVAKVQGQTGSTMTAKGAATTNNGAPKVQSPVTYSAQNTVKPVAKGGGAPSVTVKGPAATSSGPKQTAQKPKEVKPATYSNTVESTAPTTMTVNGNQVVRNVRNGKGQEGDDLFVPVSELHFVQFAVYCKGVPVDKAPAIEGLYLLWHPDSKCPKGEQGASYVVKGYTSAEAARAAVKSFKAAKIDCWYNPALSGAEVEIIGVR